MYKFLRLLVLPLAAALATAVSLSAADESAPAAAVPAASDAKPPIFVDLEALIGTVRSKIEAAQGAIDASALKAEMAQFDAIIAKYPDAKPEERAGVLWAKALIYLQVFEDYDQCAAIVRTFKTDYPGTEFAAKADVIIAEIEKERKAQEFRDSLVEGREFPGLEGKALDGKPVGTATLKGKVVLIDFWATWCPPCRAEIPNVLAAYEKYHAKGFEVIAVSLDRDEADLKKFVEEKEMPWAQIYEGASEIAEQYGVESIPTTYLIDADGKIAARDLRGDDLEKKLEELLGAK